MYVAAIYVKINVLLLDFSQAAVKEVEAKRLGGKASQDKPASVVKTNHGNILEMEQRFVTDHHVTYPCMILGFEIKVL